MVYFLGEMVVFSVNDVRVKDGFGIKGFSSLNMFLISLMLIVCKFKVFMFLY